MARFTALRSIEDDADRLRAYGVPLIQRGIYSWKGAMTNYASPLWALQLIKAWPLSRSEDFDHSLLKQVIRRIVRTGDVSFGDAVCTVARLDGVRGVGVMLGE